MTHYHHNTPHVRPVTGRRREPEPDSGHYHHIGHTLYIRRAGKDGKTGFSVNFRRRKRGFSAVFRGFPEGSRDTRAPRRRRPPPRTGDPPPPERAGFQPPRLRTHPSAALFRPRAPRRGTRKKQRHVRDMSVTPVPGNTGCIRRPAFIILSRGEFPDTYPPAYPGYPAGGFLSRIPAYDTYPYIHIHIHIHIIRPAAYPGQIDDRYPPAAYFILEISFIFISGRRLILDIRPAASYSG